MTPHFDPLCATPFTTRAVLKRCPRIFEKTNLLKFYLNRTIGGDCHHRHPCRHAAPGLEQGQIKSSGHSLPEQPPTAFLGVEALQRRQWRHLPYVKHGPYEWVGGWLDFTGNRENWDPQANLTRSILWPYLGGSQGIFQMSR